MAAALPPIGAAGALLLGVISGGALTWLIPHRLFPGVPLTGVSLILSPLVAIAVMRWYGARRVAAGRPVSILTTPLGAAGFALGFAGVRVVWLHWMTI